MDVFKMFKKEVPREEPADIYPISIVYLSKFYDEINELFNELDLGNDLEKTVFMNARIIPEPTNEVDKNALIVFAAKRGKKNNYHPIGYIPADMTGEVKVDDQLVASGKYYWYVRLGYHRIAGSSFRLGINRSKYAK